MFKLQPTDRPLFVVLAAIVVLLAAVVLKQPKSDTQQAKGHYENADQREGQPDVLTLNATRSADGRTVEIQIPTEILQAAAQAEANAEDKDSGFIFSPDSWVAIFTLALTISTILLWQGGEKQAMLLRESIDKAEVSSERQLRAYVYLEIEARPYPPDKPDRYSIVFSITNTGSTWARNIVILRKVITNAATDADPFDELKAQKPEGGKILLGPGQVLKLQFGDIPTSIVPAIAAKTLTVDYVAWVKYEDTLSNPAILRQTQISQHLNGDAEGGVSFSYRPTHNCADDDCV
ncbi:MAG: hypothetical protein P4L72_05125 [Parvibaculum sp.]|uniref:hypothetical protein n=1 Tax=Parvibaculum sp. TaxID=2024848 RepID=UPI00284C0369|nr:hypothetical protein [Parvibaculum sp.]MDR3498593.1 hypothetical protein [Parvibaculum sp.]